MSQYTPMMQQYLKLRQSLPEGSILFFRLGDFYEMFFEDAKQASALLDLVLTGREAGKGNRVPMCGIPYHSAKAYVSKLVKAGFKVAICEQVEDASQAKGLVERQVTRMITPATNLDEQEGDEPSYIATLIEREESASLAYLDLGTGEFKVSTVSKKEILNSLAALQAKEVVLPESKRDSELLSRLKDHFSESTVTFYEDWVFDEDHASELLLKEFNLHSLEVLGLTAAEQSAAGVLVYYLRDHHYESLGHLNLPKSFLETEYMRVDQTAQKHLELFEAFDSEDKKLTLYGSFKQTKTPMGARCLWRWMKQPLLNVGSIEERLNAVEYFVSSREILEGFRVQLAQVGDIERLLARLTCGRATGRDLIVLKEFLALIPKIKMTLENSQKNLIQTNLREITLSPSIHQLITESIVDEPPMTLKDGGLIRDGYDSDLDEYRRLSNGGKEGLLRIQEREVQRTGIKNMKIKFNRVFGYYLEISNANLASVPEDYIRKQTLVNAERYITPELKEYEEKILSATEKAQVIEEKLFEEIKQQILEHTASLKKASEAVGQLDCLACFAFLALRYQYVKPRMNDSCQMEIKEGRHPVVERVMPSGEFVENDVLLNRVESQLMILTGPNMAGKSTYIRQNALLVLLAQMGSFVPAKFCQIGLVDRVFTRIGASDSLARGQSTFMVEMTEVAHILHHATERSLVIMDEVGRGTSTVDGVSIAQAVCEFLVQAGGPKPRSLFATHYHELTELEERLSGVCNYNVMVREDKKGIVFLHKIVPGGTDKSYGIHVASLAGLPRSVIQRADAILKQLESNQTSTSSREQLSSQLEFAIWPKPENEKELAVIEKLREISLETMTPIEALVLLDELKKLDVQSLPSPFKGKG